ASKVIDTQVQIVQDKFLVKELINKTYADFDAYLVVKYKMKKELSAPIHNYTKGSEIILYPDETETVEISREKGESITKTQAISYSVSVLQEWGSSSKASLGKILDVGSTSKTAVQIGVEKSFGYSQTFTEINSIKRTRQITNNSPYNLQYRWQKRALFNTYVVQVFKIEYQINKWKSSSPFDFTTYYGYDNLGRMRLVDSYIAFDAIKSHDDDTGHAGDHLDAYMRQNGSWMMYQPSTDPNIWMV
ncbi:MAG: hypothetical protein LBK70_00455, partial [Clostridiales bacterium]|nr:hypothetical protein [Clostridiales bacterium]